MYNQYGLGFNPSLSNTGKVQLDQFIPKNYDLGVSTTLDPLEVSLSPNTLQTNGLGKFLNSPLFNSLGSVFTGLAALGNMFAGLKNFGLAKSMYKTQKNLANRNLANQAKIINNEYLNRARIAAALGNLTDEERKKYLDEAKQKYVSGSL